MKRSARSRAKARAKLAEPGRDEWKTIRNGRCGICRRRGPLLRHHVVYEQHVRNAGGDPWDQANALDVGAHCRCHVLHHSSGFDRVPIPLTAIPDEAIDFAVELLGYDRAVLYFARYYDAGDATTTEEGRDAANHDRLVHLRPRA